MDFMGLFICINYFGQVVYGVGQNGMLVYMRMDELISIVDVVWY